MSKLARTLTPADLAQEADTFEIAMFCYFGMSDVAILRAMPHMTKGKIQYRLGKIRKRYRVDIHRADYRDGRNALARRVIDQFRTFAQKKLTMNDLR